MEEKAEKLFNESRSDVHLMKFSFSWFFSSSSSSALSLRLYWALFGVQEDVDAHFFHLLFSLCQGQKVFISSSSAHMENPYRVASFHADFSSFVEVPLENVGKFPHWKLVWQWKSHENIQHPAKSSVFINVPDDLHRFNIVLIPCESQQFTGVPFTDEYKNLKSKINSEKFRDRKGIKFQYLWIFPSFDKRRNRLFLLCGLKCSALIHIVKSKSDIKANSWRMRRTRRSETQEDKSETRRRWCCV